MAAAEKQEAPWSVEVPESQLNLVVGPEGSILARLCKATGCQLEVAKHHNKRNGKEVFFQGQRQVVEDDGESSAPVKIFIRGAAKNRTVAAEVLRSVANGDDPEDHAARAEGAVVFPHELRHPDRQAWARWRLLSVAHGHGVRAHLGQRTVRLTAGAQGVLGEEKAAVAREAVEAVLADAEGLLELTVDALDELEPEDAPSDPALALLVEQHGIVVRVSDQDDNAVSDTIAIRLVGPPDAVRDASEILRARFVKGKCTTCVLQALGQVQAMPAAMAEDFANDLRSLESASAVQICHGRTAFWVTGDDADAVAGARKTLKDMLQFYLPDTCVLIQGLPPSVLERLAADEGLGALMAGPDCAVGLEEAQGAVWVCGKHCAAVRQLIDEVSRTAEAEGEGQPAAKKRRTSALTFHSE